MAAAVLDCVFVVLLTEVLSLRVACTAAKGTRENELLRKLSSDHMHERFLFQELQTVDRLG